MSNWALGSDLWREMSSWHDRQFPTVGHDRWCLWSHFELEKKIANKGSWELRNYLTYDTPPKAGKVECQAKELHLFGNFLEALRNANVITFLWSSCILWTLNSWTFGQCTKTFEKVVNLRCYKIGSKIARNNFPWKKFIYRFRRKKGE